MATSKITLAPVNPIAALQKLRNRVANDAAGPTGQGNAKRVKPQRLKADRAEQQQQKADAVRPGRQVIGERIGAATRCSLRKPRATVIARPNTIRYADSPNSSNAMSATHAPTRPPMFSTPAALAVCVKPGRFGCSWQHGQQRHRHDGTDNPPRLGEN